MITAEAPAKINLALHVTGRREDGYHLLSSLVAFADFGDRITVRAADTLTLEISGPFADALSAAPDNLVLRAARAFGVDKGAAIQLQKNLPVASGIGGGSADAAATLQALSQLWGEPLPEAQSLGADVPVCLAGRAAVMEGIGEKLQPFDGLPDVAIVLVNPGVAVSTPAVFGLRQGAFSAPLPPLPRRFAEAAHLAEWLRLTQNDLETPARGLVAEIDTAVAALAEGPGVLLARMSGSGATCFALLDKRADAERLAGALRARYPGWWVKSGQLAMRSQ